MAGAAFPAVVVVSLLGGAATLLAGSASAAWHARVFVVGGEPRGWRKPTAPNEESYNHWAARNRFHVGDVLRFKYERNDSVLVVTRDAYQLCVVDRPTQRFQGGDTRFRLDHGGFFYFISGTAGNCDAGQRMTLRVIVPAEAPAAAAMSPEDGDDDEGGTFDPAPPGARRRPSPPGSGGGSSSPGSGDGNKTSAAAGSAHDASSSSSPSSLHGRRVCLGVVVALATLLLLLLLPA